MALPPVRIPKYELDTRFIQAGIGREAVCKEIVLNRIHDLAATARRYTDRIMYLIDAWIPRQEP